MNGYTENREVTRTDCLDVLNDIERDLRGLFILTNDASTSDGESEPWAYALIADMAFQMAEGVSRVVAALKTDEGGARADG